MICLAAFVFARSKRYFFVGWFVFAGMMFPVSGIGQVGEQAFADRFHVFAAYRNVHGVRMGAMRNRRGAFGKWRSLSVCLSPLRAFQLAYLQAQHWDNSEDLFSNSMRVARRTMLLRTISFRSAIG